MPRVQTTPILPPIQFAVALGASVWANELKLPDADRDALEVAALLHDVGKIGVPDRVLMKPGILNEEEQAIVDRHRLMGWRS